MLLEVVAYFIYLSINNYNTFKVYTQIHNTAAIFTLKIPVTNFLTTTISRDLSTSVHEVWPPYYGLHAIYIPRS